MRRRRFLNARKREQEIMARIQARQRAQLFAAKDAATKILADALGMGLRTATLCLSTKAKPKPKPAAKPVRGLRKHESASSLSPYRRAREMIGGKGLRFNNPMYRRKTVFTDGWKNLANKLDYTNMANGTSKTPMPLGRARSRSPPASAGSTESLRTVSFRLPKDSEGDSADKGMTRYHSSPHMLVNSMNIPNMPSGAVHATVEVVKPAGASIPTFSVAPSAPVAQPVVYSAEEQEEIDHEHEKALRLAMLHKQREDEMEAERAARLKLIEEVR
jgi:hypothetical protein